MKTYKLLTATLFIAAGFTAQAFELKPIGMDAISTTESNKMIGMSALAMPSEDSGVIYVLSDDSGWSTQKIGGQKVKNFARFNQLSFDGSVYPPVVYEGEEDRVIELKDKKGDVIDGGAIDPEGMALMKNGNVLISSEQDISSFNIYPTIIQFDSSGVEVQTYDLPDYFSNAANMNPATWGMWGKGVQGVERNKGIEGITIIPGSDDGRIAIMTETPLVQDKGHKDSLVRFTVFDLKKDKLVLVEEYAYPLDKFKKGDGHPLTGLEDEPLANGEKLVMVKSPSSGVSDILAIGENEFIAIERTHMLYAPETQQDNKKAWISKSIIRLYAFSIDDHETNLVSFDKYGNYGSVHSIPKDVVPLDKELIIDLSEINTIEGEAVELDHYNIEGITYTTLKDGREVLILVSDNGDAGSQAAKQPTTFFIFELIR